MRLHHDTTQLEALPRSQPDVGAILLDFLFSRTLSEKKSVFLTNYSVSGILL
jgi:hypothetical protein